MNVQERVLNMHNRSHKLWHYLFVLLKHLVKGPAVFLLGLFLLLIGVIFLSIKNWSFWVLGVGIPLIVLGVSFVIYGAYDLIFGIFSSHHQLIDCPFCNYPIKSTSKGIAVCKNCKSKIEIKG